MWRSSLVVAVLLLFSSAVLSQHTSGGGGGSSGGGGSHAGSSGGGIGSSGGGGFHGTSSGGGSSGGFHSSSGGSASSSHSSGTHTSGGAISHGGGGYGSPVRSGSAPTHPTVRESKSGASRSIREPKSEMRTKQESKPEKRGFFSFLRHPFRKHEPRPVVAKLRPICPQGVCRVCPPGLVREGGACVSHFFVRNRRPGCSPGEIWEGGACLAETHFLDDCSSARLSMERQLRLMDAAESARQNACASGPTEMCTGLTSRAESEASLYRTFQDKYRQCRQRSGLPYSFNEHALPNYFQSLSFDPLNVDTTSRGAFAIR